MVPAAQLSEQVWLTVATPEPAAQPATAPPVATTEQLCEGPQHVAPHIDPAAHTVPPDEPPVMAVFGNCSPPGRPVPQSAEPSRLPTTTPVAVVAAPPMSLAPVKHTVVL